jgi:hypothetical protein
MPPRDQRGRPDLLMPVSDEKAVHLIEIEAMRQIVDNLKRLNDRTEEQTKMLHAMDKRLDRIESNKLDRSVVELEKRIESLEQDKFRRDGAVGMVEWASRFGPWLLGLLVAILAFIWGRSA